MRTPKTPPNLVIPAQGWELNGLNRFQRTKDDSGQALDLVRLSDLVRWLQERDGVPRKEAARILMNALPDDVMQWLYWLEPTEWASRVAQHREPAFPTRDDLIDYVINHWFGNSFTTSRNRGSGELIDVLDDFNDSFSCIAIPHVKANALLGWGSVAEVVPQVSNAEASEAALLNLLDAYERRGSGVTRIQFAAAKGLSEANLKKRLTEARELKKPATKPASIWSFAGGKK